MAYSAQTAKLTRAGVWTGGAVGLFLFLGCGWLGVGLITLFFVLGSGATSWKRAEKRQLGLVDQDHGPRTAGQVLANAGVAGLLGTLAWLIPAVAPLAPLLVAGSFAAATADTLSSELGNVYGRRYYHVLTGRPDRRGENGVVSLEGTLLGLAGSALVAAVYCLASGWGPAFGWLLVAGTAGNLADSVLGATLERRGYVGNNAVNAVNTLVGALTAGGLAALS
ncbi:TIGR00297 family protein [Hymenobacter arizonensis]|uniref:TIGR00297 family protein n=2 Tax=Hymenobacter arizonensis TaxID=1227077 RepID=A0A1I5YW96_HYMAR|nr:TIGR00297 family protein [Hymenobacter arizonensis]